LPASSVSHNVVSRNIERVNIFYEIFAFTSVCFTSQAGTAKVMRKVAHLSQHHSWDLNSVVSGSQPDMLLPT